MQYAGILCNKASEWYTLTDNEYVRQAIRGYSIEFLNIPYQIVEPQNPKITKSEKLIVNDLVDRLVSIGAIKQVIECSGQFISPIFAVPKANGKHRLVINLKSLNNFVIKDHFKMEDWRTVVRLLDRGMFMAKLDLTDAYHLVNVSEMSRKYLRFKWEEKLYEYTCLCFGLTSAPRVFTKIMKEVVKKLRSENFLSVIYLDDFLLFADTYDDCVRNVKETIKLLQELGFIISDKSMIEPAQTCEFLGLIFDSSKMIITLPQRKVVQIKKMCIKAMTAKTLKISEIAEIVGTLVAATPGVGYSPLYTRQIEFDKTQSLLKSNGDFQACMSLSEQSKQDLAWWLTNVDSFSRIPNYDFSHVIFTDASLFGYGAACGVMTYKGEWSEREKLFHINILELLAIEKALHHFIVSETNIQILLRVDNKAAIAYINKYGGCRSAPLHDIAKRIWQWCEKRGIIIHASYIKSEENIVADGLSRGEDMNSEWKLNEKYFARICKKFGFPEIDLFASYLNNQVRTYNSWFPDKNAMQVDSLLCKWDYKLPYAFPPFSLIPKVLQKIKNEQATVILVVPNWPGQPWYPLYHLLRISDILRMGPDKQLLICPFSRKNHPMKSLELQAAILCGQPLKRKV